MATFDNTYSRFIALAKVLLPLAALLILSTIFLVSRDIDPTASIPYAKVDVEQLIRDQGISEATYSTLSNDGTAITFRAAKILPDVEDDNRTNVETVEMWLDYPDGSRVELTSDGGMIDDRNDLAHLQGDVLITTSEGYQMSTDALTADLEGAWLRSDSKVEMDSPTGRLTAGRMEIRQSDTSPGHHVLDFKDGVKLVYTPQPKEDAR